MPTCTVTGTYLNNRNPCDSFSATVTIELTGDSNSLSYSSNGNNGCGTEFILSNSVLNGVTSIYFAGSRPNTSGAISQSVFNGLLWLGQPTVVCTVPQTQYDCINGACIAKATYNTPGIYQSLSECETSCGTGCSGKCISNSEWAQIEGLANQLKNQNCS